MKHHFVLAAVAAVLACGLGAARGAPRGGAPLEAYGKLPTMDMVSISPDGTKIAFVQPVNGQQAVVVDQIRPAAVLTGVAPTDQKVRGLIWADPNHLLVIKSYAGFAHEVVSARTEWYMVQSLDVAKRQSMALLNQNHDFGPDTHVHGVVTMNVTAGTPEARMVRGHPTVFTQGVAFVGGRGTASFVSVDLTSGLETLIETAVTSYENRDWIISSQGDLLAQTTYDEYSQTWSLRLRRGDSWAPAYSTKVQNDPPSVRGLSPDGSALVLELFKDGDLEYRPLSLADGKLGEPISQYDGLDGLITDPITHRIIGGVKIGMEPDYVFFDAKDQASWDSVVNSFPNEQVDLVSWSNDRSKVVVRVTGLLHGIIYALVDLSTHQAMSLGQAYAGLGPNDLAEVHLATYRAADGRAIRAFLTLPNGRDPKGLPMIVLPHGGPAARDAAGFDWWSQALASRGYAVLQPEFRGSSGFGWELESAGFGEWGRKMQSDLSDGVRALAAKGYIDPKRVCIVGGSYGGYAALAGVTMERGVYRCAVSVAGVSDVRKLIGGQWADADRSSGVRYWDRFMGAKDPNDPVLDQISPVRHAAEASAPILLVHGREDTVVPIEQSQKMADALKDAKKPVEFVTLAGEDHWLSREDTRLQMLQATVTFLEKNNPPR